MSDARRPTDASVRERIRKAMRALDLSQSAIGARLGISQAAVSQILSGDSRASQQTVLLLEVIEGEAAARRERNAAS